MFRDFVRAGSAILRTLHKYSCMRKEAVLSSGTRVDHYSLGIFVLGVVYLRLLWKRSVCRAVTERCELSLYYLIRVRLVYLRGC